MPMLSFATETGHAFIDRELHLSAPWIESPARCKNAGVPAPRGFVTKPRLVTETLERTLGARVPFHWFAADSGYGRDPDLREFCHANAVSYVLAVPCDLPLVEPRGGATPGQSAALGRAPVGAPVGRVRQQGPGAPTTGRCAVTVKGQTPVGGYDHHLLIRRSKEPKQRKGRVAMHEIEYFLVHAPENTAVPQMIRAAGLRWKIEQDNQTGKDQLALDRYQVRKYIPCYRHATLAMLAAAFLTVARTGLGRDPKTEHGQSVG